MAKKRGTRRVHRKHRATRSHKQRGGKRHIHLTVGELKADLAKEGIRDDMLVDTIGYCSTRKATNSGIVNGKFVVYYGYD